MAFLDAAAWERLCPADCFDPLVREIESYLDSEDTQHKIRQSDRLNAYPTNIFDDLRKIGVNRFFIESDGDPYSRVTSYHIGALSTVAVRRSGSLAITLGVNGLALLPLYLSGTSEQCKQVFEAVQEGTFASLLLTEFENGSDLLRNKTKAEPIRLYEGGRHSDCALRDGEYTHFRLSGEKDLINGGHYHDVLIILANTPHSQNSVDPLRDYTVFYVRRDESVKRKPRWNTHPARSADISGATFDGTLIPRENVLGGTGNGFNVVQRTLMMSRGGVSVLGSGAASQALGIVRDYACSRQIYGKSLLSLGGVRELVQRMHMMDLLAAAVSLKATAFTNSFGPGAAHYTAIAKYLSCSIGEEAVNLGATVLSSRALVEGRYETLLRDVRLYSVFDGTSLVMLDQVQLRLRKMASRNRDTEQNPIHVAQRVYQSQPNSLVRVTRLPSRIVSLPLVDYLKRIYSATSYAPLKSLQELAEIFMEIVSKLEERFGLGNDQATQFELAKVFCLLEGLVALADLSNNKSREVLGIKGKVKNEDEIACGAAIRFFGSRAFSGVREVLYKYSLDKDERNYLASLSCIESQLMGSTSAERSAFESLYIGLADKSQLN